MPAYSFKERFVPFILNGEKRQTIRAKRKYQARPGDSLYLFVGMRTKWCKRLLDTTCKDVKGIRICKNGSVFVDGEKLNDMEKDHLAFLDGFRLNEKHQEGNFELMIRFWRQTHSLPFKGDIIYW